MNPEFQHEVHQIVFLNSASDRREGGKHLGSGFGEWVYMETCPLEEDTDGVIRCLGRHPPNTFSWGESEVPTWKLQAQLRHLKGKQSSPPHHFLWQLLDEACACTISKNPMSAEPEGRAVSELPISLSWVGTLSTARGELGMINFLRKIILKFSLLNQPPDLIHGGHLF